MRTARRALEAGAWSFAATLGLLAAYLTPFVLAEAWESWRKWRCSDRDAKRTLLGASVSRPTIRFEPSSRVELKEHPDGGWDLFVDQVSVGTLALTPNGHHMVDMLLRAAAASGRQRGQTLRDLVVVLGLVGIILGILGVLAAAGLLHT